MRVIAMAGRSRVPIHSTLMVCAASPCFCLTSYKAADKMSLMLCCLLIPPSLPRRDLFQRGELLVAQESVGAEAVVTLLHVEHKVLLPIIAGRHSGVVQQHFKLRRVVESVTNFHSRSPEWAACPARGHGPLHHCAQNPSASLVAAVEWALSYLASTPPFTTLAWKALAAW